jgi:hypothetical protein
MHTIESPIKLGHWLIALGFIAVILLAGWFYVKRQSETVKQQQMEQERQRQVLVARIDDLRERLFALNSRAAEMPSSEEMKPIRQLLLSLRERLRSAETLVLSNLAETERVCAEIDAGLSDAERSLVQLEAALTSSSKR